MWVPQGKYTEALARPIVIPPLLVLNVILVGFRGSGWKARQGGDGSKAGEDESWQQLYILGSTGFRYSSAKLLINFQGGTLATQAAYREGNKNIFTCLFISFIPEDYKVY